MSDSILSKLAFTHYVVDELVFSRNAQYRYGSEPPSLKVALNTNIAIAPDNHVAFVTLACTMFDEEFDESTAPFHLKVALTGQFTCPEDLDIQPFQANAVSILLPYLREVISSFTAQAGIPPVIMPPINVYQLLENQSSSEESEDSQDNTPVSDDDQE